MGHTKSGEQIDDCVLSIVPTSPIYLSSHVPLDSSVFMVSVSWLRYILESIVTPEKKGVHLFEI